MLMNDHRAVDPGPVLRAAAADLPENQPAALQALGQVFPELSIEAAIGRGGSGVVYRVRQTRLARLAALKILDRELVAREPSFVERFEREGRAMAQLDHPGILKVYDFGQRDGRCYLLSEYVDGIDLRQLMAMGALQPAEAMRLVPPICEALQYAHDHGVVHRDIKPENVLVDVDGRVKLADFGLARLQGAAEAGPQLTRDSQVMGTPRYMAPEQWRGAAVDHRADIFALGVVLYELLTGQVPAGAYEPASQRPGVPRGIDEVVRRALAQDPTLRYQRAEELGRDVGAQAVGGRAPVRPSPSLSRESTKPNAGWLLAGAVVSLLCTGGIGFITRALMERDRRALADYSSQAVPYETEMTAYLVIAILLVVMTCCGQVAVSRIVRAGPPLLGLSWALFFAWIAPLVVFDVCAWFGPGLTGQDDPQWMKMATILLVPLNIAFVVLVYRRALHQARVSAA